MAAWSEIESEAPELAARAREIFDAGIHKTVATVRRDGSPRISGIEARFEDGDVWLGSMLGAVKAVDLQRDPRFALHSATIDTSMSKGDAKLAGRVEEITEMKAIERINGPQEEGSHLFRCDITELVVTRVGDPRDHLVIESWHEGRGYERRERR